MITQVQVGQEIAICLPTVYGHRYTLTTIAKISPSGSRITTASGRVFINDKEMGCHNKYTAPFIVYDVESVRETLKQNARSLAVAQALSKLPTQSPRREWTDEAFRMFIADIRAVADRAEALLNGETK